MKVEVLICPPNEINGMWNAIAQTLRPALDEDLFTDEPTLKKMLIDDKALLWVAFVDDIYKGACITTIETPKTSVVNIMTLAGDDFDQWKDKLNEALTFYAKEMQCSHIVALGRDAWQRLWPDFQAGKRLYTKRIAA